MEIISVTVEKPEEINFVLGQSHFIKTVEDVYEALVSSVPGIQFGFAFCEASGKCLIRYTGTNDEMIELAKMNAFPINVLHALQRVPEIVTLFCATANPTEVVMAETENGRGILGVIDGSSPKGIEGADDIAWRKGFLRTIGYKL